MRKTTNQIAAPATNATQNVSALPEKLSSRHNVLTDPRHAGNRTTAIRNFSHFGTGESRRNFCAVEKR